MLALWRTWSPKAMLSFKLPRASCTGRQLATTLTHVHLHWSCEINSTFSSTLTTLYMDGLIGELPIKFLLDSGATMSVVRYDFKANHQITRATTLVVGTNGTSLDVIGHTILVVSLGIFTTQQKFTVVRQLTLDCLLGANFLMNHHTIIDYCSKILTVGKQEHHSIPLTLGRQSSQMEESVSADIIVRCPHNIAIPGRTVHSSLGKLIQNMLSSPF